MKRKKLLDFAKWLETAGGEFNVMSARECISWQACRWNGDIKRRRAGFAPGEPKTELVIVSSKFDRRAFSMRGDLRRIFDIDDDAAEDLYAGWPPDTVTRQQAANAVRTLARSGRVDWHTAMRV